MEDRQRGGGISAAVPRDQRQPKAQGAWEGGGRVVQ